ncbi:RICIN domain-containing protein [Streptomyces sp. NPDC091272]|uniref:RICIN domain-containing protein n=1 Tax=Streptomyces sp. NPDC091272 TaxID=3365981 RepID=UPI003823FA1A
MRALRTLLLGGALALASLASAPGALALEGDPAPQGTETVTTPAGAVDAIQSFRNQATGRCLDDTDNGGFRAWSCNGSNPQKWSVHVWGDSTRQLRNVATGRCIEDTDNGFRTVGACNSSPEQSWWVTVWGDGTVRFQNQLTGRCIDDSSLGLRTWGCNNTPYQSWS